MTVLNVLTKQRECHGYFFERGGFAVVAYFRSQMPEDAGGKKRNAKYLLLARALAQKRARS